MNSIIGNRERSKLRQRRLLLENAALYYAELAIRVRKWRKKNPEKRKAQIAVFVAVRNGKLKKKPCKFCGSLKSEAHHKDYSKPLKVIWYCKTHHRLADRGVI